MKRKGGSLIVLVLIIVALFALNPTMADFKAYQEKKASSSISGVLGKLAGKAASALSELGFTRANYGIASVFYTGSKERMNNRYLGIAKLFISLDAQK